MVHLDTLRQAARGIRRRPAAAIMSIAILGAGIGASVAVFAVLSAVLLEPLPYAEPDRLVVVEHHDATARGRDFALDGLRGSSRAALIPAPDAAVYGRAATLEAVGFVRDIGDGVVVGPGGATAARVGVVSASLFEVLGVRPTAGRLPAVPRGAGGAGGAGDTGGEGAAHEVIVSHAFFRDHLGGASEAIGSALRVDGPLATVVGVLPADFRLALPPSAGLADRADVWLRLPVPLEDLRRTDRLRDQDSDNRGVVIARLADGARPAEAEAELTLIRHRLAREQGDLADDGRVAVSVLQQASNATARPVLLALFAAVLLVLLLTAANVAGLLLARSADRSSELAVRAALGAGRRELTGLVAWEGLLIGLGAGLTGLVLGTWGRDLLLGIHSDLLGTARRAPLDGRLLVFSLLATLAATVAATAIPAFRAGRPGRLAGLRTDAAPTAGAGAARARRVLVVAELACALGLLAAAGLLTRTAMNLGAVQSGFDAGPVTTFELSLVDPERYRGPGDRGRLVRALTERLEAEPGVAAAGVIGGLPLSGEAFEQPWGRPGEPPEEWAGSANFRVVSDGYFAALGTPLVAGRAFRPADDRQDVRVVIIDRSLAARLAPEGRAVGRSIAIPLDGQAETARVIGVVENVRFEDLRTPGRPTVYVPYRHEASRRVTVAVRSVDGGPLPRARLARAVASVDPDLPLVAYAPMRDHVRRATADTRFALGVFTGFALLASLLAAVGTYALVARWVAGRTAEIGIRMALGADRVRIVTLVLRETALLLPAALAAGVLAGALLGRSARALLFDVAPIDPFVFASAAVLLTATALAASLLPARRAARLPPSTALRA